MKAEKDPKTGKWLIQYRYTDWQGKRRKSTKRGFATEAVNAFLPVIMPRFGLDRIKGICLADNKASQKVMERCGFIKEYEGPGPYQGAQRNICRYYYSL